MREKDLQILVPVAVGGGDTDTISQTHARTFQIHSFIQQTLLSAYYVLGAL